MQILLLLNLSYYRVTDTNCRVPSTSSKQQEANAAVKMIATNVIIVINILRFKQCTFTASIVGSRQYCINSYIKCLH